MQNRKPNVDVVMTKLKPLEREGEIVAAQVINHSNAIATLETEVDIPYSSRFLVVRDKKENIRLKQNVSDTFLSAIPDSNLLLSYSAQSKGRPGGVTVWNLDDQKKQKSAHDKKTLLFQEVISTKDYAVGILPESKKIRIELRHLPSFKLLDSKLRGVDPSNGPVTLVNNILYRATQNGFECWQISNNKLQKIEIQPTGDYIPPLAIAVLPDHKTVVTGHAQGDLRFWDLSDSKPTRLLKHFIGFKEKELNHDVSNLLPIPDSKHIVSWHNQTMYLWDISNLNNPNIVNKVNFDEKSICAHHATLTEDWGILTTNGALIEFPELRAAYKQNHQLKLLSHTSMSDDVVNLTVQHLGFFASTLPEQKPLGKTNTPDLKMK
jgi:WD40 repeat protein